MADQPDIAEDLFSFAQALLRQLVKRHQLAWGEHRIEDAAQDLFLTG